MAEATFFHDLIILIEYLNKVAKTDYEMGIYERKFRTMLKDVLPQ